MSDIIKDIVDNVEIKPNKTKTIIKWIISISLTLISAAFIFGQFKSSFFNRLDRIEKSVDNSTKATTDLKQQMLYEFSSVNARIDKVYTDGYKAFNDFQQYNNKQLGIIIDYGKSDKDLLKRMLDLNTMEKTKSVENELEQDKRTKPDSISIRINQIPPIKKEE
jgi:uncharacterized protein YxeA